MASSSSTSLSLSSLGMSSLVMVPNTIEDYNQFRVTTLNLSEDLSLTAIAKKTSTFIQKLISSSGLGNVGSFLITAISLPTKVKYLFKYGGEIVKEGTGKVQIKTYEGEYFDTLARLDKMCPISPTDIERYNNILKTEVGKSCSSQFFISETGIPTDDELSSALNKGIPIIIPFLLSSGIIAKIYPAHMTTLIIDPRKRQIIYIDTKGDTLIDHKTRIINKTLNAINSSSYSTVEKAWSSTIAKIREIYGKSAEQWTLLQNTHKIQEDTFNCGVHLCHYAKEYAIKGKITNHLDTFEKVRRERESIIQEFEEVTKNTSSHSFILLK